MKPSALTPSYRLFVGGDIAYRDFAAALLVPGEQAKCEPKAFAQTAEGFDQLQQRLLASGLEPASILLVMEATGNSRTAHRNCQPTPYWMPNCLRWERSSRSQQPQSRLELKQHHRTSLRSDGKLPLRFC